MFTACFLIAAVWPVFYGSGFVRKNRLLVVWWAACCAAMSAFTLLPVVKQESEGLMYVPRFLPLTEAIGT